MGQEKPKADQVVKALMYLLAGALMGFATWQFWQAGQLFHEMGKMIGAK